MKAKVITWIIVIREFHNSVLRICYLCKANHWNRYTEFLFGHLIKYDRKYEAVLTNDKNCNMMLCVKTD